MIEFENLGRLNQLFEKELQDEFNAILHNGWFILGERVTAFERQFADYCGSHHCIGVASGLDALVLSIKALDLPAGSEIIVPANTYYATILAIVLAGCRPVPVEPDMRTYNIDPEKIVPAVTSKTRAIVAVHLYGQPCEMHSIAAIAEQYGLAIIEDCAQSHGASIGGRMTGTFGTFGAFSFYPTKNLGALGDGGAVVTDSDEMADKLFHLRNYGSRIRYKNEFLGMNSRLDELQSGFLSIKLRALNGFVAHKRKLARLYLDRLNGEFIRPAEINGLINSYHIFPVRHPRRDGLRTFLKDNGIGTDIHYPLPPHRQKAMTGILDQYELPITDEIHKTILSLPISVIHSEEEINTVIDVMNRF